MYDNALKGNKVTMIHLFGITYAKDVKQSGALTKDLAKRATGKESYHAEISKGVRLSKYVKIKTF